MSYPRITTYKEVGKDRDYRFHFTMRTFYLVSEEEANLFDKPKKNSEKTLPFSLLPTIRKHKPKWLDKFKVPIKPCNIRQLAATPTAECAEAEGAEAEGAEANSAEANSAEADGAEANGAEANGAEANGAEANGAEANGAEANGAEANGAEANGAEANGAEANGAEANGAEANGAEANSAEANGAEANGAEANSAEANGAKAKGAGANGAEAKSASAKKAAAKSASAKKTSYQHLEKAYYHSYKHFGQFHDAIKIYNYILERTDFGGKRQIINVPEFLKIAKERNLYKNLNFLKERGLIQAHPVLDPKGKWVKEYEIT